MHFTRIAARGGTGAITVVTLAFAVAPTLHGQSQSGGDSIRAAGAFLTHRDIAVLGFSAVGTALLTRFDTRIARFAQTPAIQGSPRRHHVVRNLTRVNESTLTVAALASYGIGRLARSRTSADVGLHAAEAIVVTSVVSQLIRGPLGRSRPHVTQDSDPYDFHWFAGFRRFDFRAFPSLHAATAFAATTAAAEELHLRHSSAAPIAVPALLVAGAVPGLTRMYLDQHWASDIAMGAVLGITLGTAVVRYAHNHRTSSFERALLGADVSAGAHGGSSIRFSYNF